MRPSPARRWRWPGPARRSRSARGRCCSTASTPTAGKNWTAIEARASRVARRGDRHLKAADPLFTDPPTETNEAAIRTFWDGQLYTVIGKPDPSGALAAALVVEAVRDADLGGRGADRARRGPGACSGASGCAGARREWRESDTHESRRPLRAAGAVAAGRRRLWSGGLRRRRHDGVLRSSKASRCRPFALPPRCRPSRLCRRPISHGRPRLLNIFASWCVPCITEVKCSTSSSAKASRSTESRCATGPRTLPPSSPATATRTSGSAATRKAGCRSRSARRACPKASSSMAAASSATSISGRSRRRDVPVILQKLEQAR